MIQGWGADGAVLDGCTGIRRSREKSAVRRQQRGGGDKAAGADAVAPGDRVCIVAEDPSGDMSSFSMFV